MGFLCIFLPCFSFVVKAFPAASPPLSGKPDSNFSSILGLRPWGRLAASFSIWEPVTFCPAAIPACARGPLPFLHSWFPCRGQSLWYEAAYVRQLVLIKFNECITLKEVTGVRNEKWNQAPSSQSVVSCKKKPFIPPRWFLTCHFFLVSVDWIFASVGRFAVSCVFPCCIQMQDGKLQGNYDFVEQNNWKWSS